MEKEIISPTEPRKAWEGVPGFTTFDEPVTVRKALETIQGDFLVEKQPLMRMPDHVLGSLLTTGRLPKDITLSALSRMVVKSHQATVNTRDDETLGVVGKDYGIVQNHQAFEFIDYLCNTDVNGGHPIIEACGQINHGSTVYFSARMPVNFRIGGDSGIDEYVLFHTSHDCSCAVTVVITPIRLVCQNCLNASLQSRNKITFRHSKNVMERIDLTREDNQAMVKQVLGLHTKYSKEFVDSLDYLRLQRVSHADVAEFATKVILDEARQIEQARLNNWNIQSVDSVAEITKKRIGELLNSIESGVGQNENRGTKLWLYNGLTTHYANDVFFGTTKDTPEVRATRRFRSIIGGAANDRVQKGFALLMT